MLYLLDADTVITGDRNAYPVTRFPVFWDWVAYQAEVGNVKIPLEQFEEITGGKGEIVDWLKQTEISRALKLAEDSDPTRVSHVTDNGYGRLLTVDEIEEMGRDPFLIAHALKSPADRTVVTFEVSSPSKKRAKRKVPDVCASFGIKTCSLFEMIKALDFTTGWRRP